MPPRFDDCVTPKPEEARENHGLPTARFHRPERWADQPSAKPPVPLRTTLVFLQVRGAPGGAFQEPRGEVQPSAASPPRSLPTPRQPAPARSPALLGAAGSPRRRQDASVFQPLSAALWFEPAHREAPPLLQRLLQQQLGWEAGGFPRAPLLSALTETLIIHLLCRQELSGVRSIKLSGRVN